MSCFWYQSRERFCAFWFQSSDCTGHLFALWETWNVLVSTLGWQKASARTVIPYFVWIKYFLFNFSWGTVLSSALLSGLPCLKQMNTLREDQKSSQLDLLMFEHKIKQNIYEMEVRRATQRIKNVDSMRWSMKVIAVIPLFNLRLLLHLPRP